jgi:peptide/nickel transport system substrate-binding protein
MAVELPPPDAELLQRLHLQYPAQVHASLIGATFLHMNTKLAPFDDVRVRQAISYAVDRAQMVEVLGGEIQARVTCQVLGPQLPGYSAYCPYTVNPNPGGTWTAPDLAEARGLIAAAQPASKDITILAFGRFVPVADLVAAALDQLGFQATVRAFESPGQVLDELTDEETGPLVQAAVLQWIPDVRATFDEVYPIFECDNPLNFTRFCDESISSGVREALALQQSDPSAARQAWASVDRTIVDRAPAAPLVTLVYLDVVSSGVGNYQFHPQWGPLYDQFWVK